ncbi:MAG: hypothetical protein AB2536_06955, partial [Candidatus Thiodiazotropha endolucinida]
QLNATGLRHQRVQLLVLSGLLLQSVDFSLLYQCKRYENASPYEMVVSSIKKYHATIFIRGKFS